MSNDAPPTCSRRQVLRAAVGGGALAAVGTFLAACTRTSPNKGDSPSSVVDVTSFGAVGDGVTDDTAAIQRALNSLVAEQVLQFPADKIFCHNDVLTISTVGVTIEGPGELRATDEERSAVKIRADGVVVRDLTLGIARTTKRWSTPDQHKLFVDQVTGVRVQDIRITGSAAAGLFALGARGFRFERVNVSDTRADGIHMTFGSHDGVVDHPVVTRSGDDGVAVVSYLQDGVTCHDIQVISPAVRATTWGRGLSVVGGQNVSFRDVAVEGTSAAAVYIACEGDPSNTYDTTAVSVTGGTLNGANTNEQIDHGAVLVYSGRPDGSVHDIEVSDLTVSGTRAGASRQIGVVTDDDADRVSNVVFRGLRLALNPQPYQGNAPSADVRLLTVTADGRVVTT